MSFIWLRRKKGDSVTTRSLVAQAANAHAHVTHFNNWPTSIGAVEIGRANQCILKSAAHGIQHMCGLDSSHTAVYVNSATNEKPPSTQIDARVFSPSFVRRSINRRITKPGLYWVTFRAEGTADTFGGVFGDVIFPASVGLSLPAPPGVVDIRAWVSPAGSKVRSFVYELTTN